MEPFDGTDGGLWMYPGTDITLFISQEAYCSGSSFLPVRCAAEAAVCSAGCSLSQFR